MDNTEIKEGEYHPAADQALEYIQNMDHLKLIRYSETFASTAMSGNRLAEICHGTLDRLFNKEPVSDRYILGLAWTLKEMENG